MLTSLTPCAGCELIEQERDHVPLDRSGYGVKSQLLPREQYEPRP